MNDKRPKVTADVQRLINMDDEVVYAKHIAPIVKMNESVIIRYAKTGQWNLCRYIVSGDRVKFFRKDFLQQCGFIDPEPEKNSTEELLTEILRQLKNLNRMVLHTMTPIQKLSFAGELMKEEEAANEN